MYANRHLALLFAMALSACASAPRTNPTPSPRGAVRGSGSLRTLIIMLDGVPYQVMDSLYRAGHFTDFRAPSLVISPFPSLTSVAFRDIWQAPLTPGYEDKYYDREKNRVAGDALGHFLGGKEGETFHDNVDVETGGFLAGLLYLFPKQLATFELRDMRRAVLQRAQKDTAVVAYLLATDAIAHRAGTPALVKVLLQVEQLTNEVRAQHGAGVRVALFSDHGNDLVQTHRVPLERVVQAAGFKPAQRLEHERDVVLPRFGLVGSAFLYTAPAAEAQLAAALAQTDGVDLVLFEDSLRRVQVWNRDGRATIDAAADGTWYRYSAAQGDPLKLAPALARLQAANTADASGAAPDSAWLRESLSTPYIDALHRIIVGMRTAVRNPASIIISFAPGYHYGDPTASKLVKVTGTHGSLRTSSSAAFFLTTEAAAPPLVRSNALLQYLPIH